jgi:predicted permease
MDADMAEELRFHIEMETEKNMRAGMEPREARRRALVAFGGVERFKEKTREERGFRPLEDLVVDLRFTIRTMRKNPGFTAVALLSLALGIGAITAIFGLVNAMLIRDLPYQAPGELVNLYRDRAQGSFDAISYPDFLALREGTEEVLQDLGGYQYALAHREMGATQETLVAEMVTGNYLTLLGIHAALGRLLLAEDHVDPGGHPVVVLGHRFWKEAFGSDPAVLGTSIRVSGRDYTVVGVAPPEFLGSNRGIAADLFAPIMMVGELMPLEANPLESRGSNAFFPVGRLRAGASMAQLEGALANVTASLYNGFPGVWQREESVVAVPTREVVFNPSADRFVRSANTFGMILVGLVLLIACTNLTSFLLARGVDRRKEMALRLGLGAARGRLIRQLVTETVLLGVLGGLLGFVLGSWLLDLTMGVSLPTPLPLGLDLSIDGRVAAFSLTLAIVAGGGVGLLPALQVTRPDLAATLKEVDRPGAGRGALALSRMLVAGQMTVSVTLLVAAGLLFRSFHATRLVDPGFGKEPTALVSFMIPSAEYSAQEGRAMISTIREEVLSLPGVTRVGVISNVHLNTVNRMMLEVNVEGVPAPEGRAAHQVDFTSVDGAFFEAAGLSLHEGRTFDETDGPEAPPVAIVNEAMARRFWPNESPLGRTIRVEMPGWQDPTVIGVVSTAKIRSLGEPPTPFLYLPYSQEYNAWVSILAVTRADPRSLATRVYTLLRQRHPEAIVTNTTTLEEHVGFMLVLRRVTAIASVLFALVALGMAVMGLYGVVSYAVVRGSREMAIRLSLGAVPASVVGLQLRRGMGLVGVGGVLGLLGAWLAARGMSSFLFGVTPSDPFTIVAVALLLAGVAFVAAFIPARRSARVDPVVSLKAE